MTGHESIPDELQAQDQWICWTTEPRDGNPTKVPVDPLNDQYASVSDPDTWCSYRAAHTYADLHNEIEGVGYVFHDTGPYAGVDIDDARDPQKQMLQEWVVDILTTLDSYTERSPSGSGYHVIVKGSVPDGGNRRDQLEMYDHARFFTVTGDHVPGTPTTVNDRGDALAAIHDEYIATDDDTEGQDPPETAITLSDKELIKKAMTAANGEKFRRLWRGDTSGYPSHSEADQALCNYLAFWTGGDQHRMERLFSQSGLTRDKWHDRADYRERTIRRAIEDVNNYYDPDEANTDSDSATTD